MSSSAVVSAPYRQRYVAALVVGTVISTLTAAPVDAAVENPAPAVHQLSRYCTACWRNAHLQPDCWGDCTQEVFCRLMERVNPTYWPRILKNETEERREFLRAIDAVKKRTQRAHRPTSLAQDVADDRDPQRHDLDEERSLVMQLAQEHLSPRQSQIVEMSLDGWSVQEIGERLDLSPARVSDEKYKAIRKLQQVV